MIWVAWRQQRTETLIAAAVLALLAVLLIPTGIEMASRYDHDGLSVSLANTARVRLEIGDDAGARSDLHESISIGQEIVLAIQSVQERCQNPVEPSDRGGWIVFRDSGREISSHGSRAPGDQGTGRLPLSGRPRTA